MKLIFRLTRVFAYKQDRFVSASNATFDTSDIYLLTRGRAWAISLSARNNTLSEKFLSASVIGVDTEDLLYRLLLALFALFFVISV
jgi:hypothetical protein